MSSTLPAIAEKVSSIDWNVVAGALAVFCVTAVTTIAGWLSGRKKSEKATSPAEGTTLPVMAGMVMDNMTVRESTMVSKEVRDQLLILNHALMAHTRNLEEVAGLLEDVVRELKDRGNR